MIYCIRKYGIKDKGIWLRKKLHDRNTGFNSGCSRMVVKYLGEFNSYHLYLDLASGGYLLAGSKLKYSNFEIVWRLEV